MLKTGPEQHTEAWQELHRTMITATDVAAILGQSEYKTALDVFLEKTGRAPPFEGNEHTRRGTRYEPTILADYAETRGVELIYPMPFVFHPKLDCLGCSPDAQRKNDGNLVEAKLSMSYTVAQELGEEGTDILPEHWVLQSQTQMECCDAEEVDFAVLLFGKLKIYNVKRNRKLGEIIQDAASDMMQRIKRDEAPEPDFSHRHTPELIKNLYDVDEGKTVLLSEAVYQLWTNYKALGDEIKALEEERKEQKARVLHAMGEAAVGILPDATIELVRSTVNRKSYTVAESSYKTLRQRKVKK